MTPIDDELRSLLHTRADAVAPAPDPLSGIERRAKRMRRNQVAAAVAGSALVVAAVAVAVPSLVPDRHGKGSVFATTAPSASAEPSPTTGRDYGPNELDPAHPWAYRGSQAVVAGNELVTLRREWSTKHPGATLSPLFGQVYEPSGHPEVVFVSTIDSEYVWGYATSSEGGWDFPFEAGLAPGTTVLMTPLPGDEVARLLILAGPATGDMSYAKDGATWRTVVGSDPGVAFVPLEGDTSQDKVRVLDGDGDMDHPVFLGPAPDYGGPTSGSSSQPVNYLDWMSRSSTYPMDNGKARSFFAQAMGRVDDTPDAVYHPLYTGQDGQITYTVGQAWFKGDTEAHTFGWASGTDNGNEIFLGPVTPKGSQLLAYVVSRPSKGTDLLVVIPRPGAGTVSYSPDATSPYVQKANGRSDLNPVALIDRDPKASNDRVQVLDGDGMKVLYDGPVAPLVCGVSGCG